MSPYQSPPLIMTEKTLAMAQNEQVQPLPWQGARSHAHNCGCNRQCIPAVFLLLNCLVHVPCNVRAALASRWECRPSAGHLPSWPLRLALLLTCFLCLPQAFAAAIYLLTAWQHCSMQTAAMMRAQCQWFMLAVTMEHAWSCHRAEWSRWSRAPWAPFVA